MRSGLPDGVEDAAGEVRDLTDGRRDAVVDDQQIVVGIERQLVGIKRPFRLGRRQGECLGERAAGGPECGKGEAGSGEGGALEEMAVGWDS